MFFFQRKKRREYGEKVLLIRNDWGVLQSHSKQGSPRLSDQELADQLQVDLPTVLKHRRD